MFNLPLWQSHRMCRLWRSCCGYVNHSGLRRSHSWRFNLMTALAFDTSSCVWYVMSVSASYSAWSASASLSSSWIAAEYPLLLSSSCVITVFNPLIRLIIFVMWPLTAVLEPFVVGAIFLREVAPKELLRLRMVLLVAKNGRLLQFLFYQILHLLPSPMNTMLVLPLFPSSGVPSSPARTLSTGEVATQLSCLVSSSSDESHELIQQSCSSSSSSTGLQTSGLVGSAAIAAGSWGAGPGSDAGAGCGAGTGTGTGCGAGTGTGTSCGAGTGTGTGCGAGTGTGTCCGADTRTGTGCGAG
ncbi:hypothetical protein OUZ56_033067 [Daphnia magna]|uniref:Uncharacterized protein n=1 Tax=Daphnia magna TaxID=35525 RepID=A0ABQ9ZXM4_9CRUS|nr:hypothetical protein OUZ56_033067 [Daphnia magna]